MIGKVLAHYRIDARLDAGGMGVVYRARDLHLERDVALKVLPPDTLADETAHKRFRREALALSRLNHPHIASVHDFDTQDGIDFLVMELVAGEPLSERIRRGAMTEAEVRALGIQIAAALEAAHEQGITHRDLKPGNVMLTPRGQVKVLDFGLAQLTRPESGADLTRSLSLTETGATLGTVPYMAPEQLLGQDVDARADLYALGVVLYEMAAGRSPYRETVATALIGEILHQPVTLLSRVAPQVSPDLEAIVARCMAKSPGDRYASARALAGDLADPGRTVAMPAAHPPAGGAHWSGRAVKLGAIVVASVLIAAGAIRFGCRSEVIRALAVMPLENMSHDPDQEYFAEGMTDELITRLAQVAALRVISRASAMQYKGTTKRPSQIASELHVDALVTGAVFRAGGQTRITAQLVRAATGQTVWGDSFEGDLRDVLALQSRVAEAIVQKIRVTLTPQERAGLARARAVDPRVNEEVLKGDHAINMASVEGWRAGLNHYAQAVRLDPTYAPAYAGLAQGYTVVSNLLVPPRDAMPKAKAAALRALQLDPAQAQAQAALAYVEAFYEWSWEAAGRDFQRAIDFNPGLPDVHRNYAVYLIAQRRYDEASAEIARAREIDPLSNYLQMVSLWPLFEGRRYDDAIASADRILSEDSTLAFVRLVLGEALTMKGDHTRAIAELRVAARDGAGLPAKAWHVTALARAGRRSEALALREQVRSAGRLVFPSRYWWAILDTGLGEKDSAFAWLDRAIEERSEDLEFVLSDPGLDPLRSDPRFADMLRRVGFRAEGVASR